MNNACELERILKEGAGAKDGERRKFNGFVSGNFELFRNCEKTHLFRHCYRLVGRENSSVGVSESDKSAKRQILE